MIRLGVRRFFFWSVDAASRPWPPVGNRGYTDRPNGRAPSAMHPWTAQHRGLRRREVTHDGTEKNGPHSRIFAASGPFLQVVAGNGFEPLKA